MFVIDGKKKSNSARNYVKQITEWISEVLQPKRDGGNFYQIMVTEIQCNEPDCVPIETLVAIVKNDVDSLTTPGAGAASSASERKNRWVGKILMPLSEVTLRDIFLFDTLREIVEESEVAAPAKTAASSAAATTTTAVTPTVAPVESTSAAPAPAIITAVPMQPRAAPKPPSDEYRVDTSSAQTPSISSTVAPVTYVASSIGNGSGTASSGGATSIVNMVPKPAPAAAPAPSSALGPSMEIFASTSRRKTPVTSYTGGVAGGPPVRHSKGTRPRGCPCCDPDNMDNIFDSMFSKPA